MGLLGLGHMGRHHARLLDEVDDIEFVIAADPSGDRHRALRGRAQLGVTVDDIIAAGVDAAVLAVPTALHHDNACALAEARVHTLIEKPLAATSAEAADIRDIFAGHDVLGAVGHVERCNSALRELKRRIDEGALGDIFSIAAVRVGPFPHRIQDVGVVKDLATHDIDIVTWVGGAPFARVYAETVNKMGREHEDMVKVAGRLTSGIMVSLEVNWVSPTKRREITVLGEKGAFVVDLLRADLTFFANGEIRSEWDAMARLRGVSEGDVHRFAFARPEPLRVQLESFRDAVRGHDTPIVTLDQGVQILEVAETILASAAANSALQISA